MLIPWAEFVAKQSALDRSDFLARNPHPFLLITSAPGEEEGTVAKTVVGGPEPDPASGVARKVQYAAPIKKAAGNPFGYMVSLGRATNNDLQFKHKRISAFHAYFRELGGKWSLYDASSSNGVFLNGRRIPPERSSQLCSNDQVNFGGAIVCLFMEAADLWEVITSQT